LDIVEVETIIPRPTIFIINLTNRKKALLDLVEKTYIETELFEKHILHGPNVDRHFELRRTRFKKILHEKEATLFEASGERWKLSVWIIDGFNRFKRSIRALNDRLLPGGLFSSDDVGIIAEATLLLSHSGKAERVHLKLGQIDVEDAKRVGQIPEGFAKPSRSDPTVGTNLGAERKAMEAREKEQATPITTVTPGAQEPAADVLRHFREQKLDFGVHLSKEFFDFVKDFVNKIGSTFTAYNGKNGKLKLGFVEDFVAALNYGDRDRTEKVKSLIRKAYFFFRFPNLIPPSNFLAELDEDSFLDNLPRWPTVGVLTEEQKRLYQIAIWVGTGEQPEGFELTPNEAQIFTELSSDRGILERMGVSAQYQPYLLFVGLNNLIDFVNLSFENEIQELLEELSESEEGPTLTLEDIRSVAGVLSPEELDAIEVELFEEITHMEIAYPIVFKKETSLVTFSVVVLDLELGFNGKNLIDDVTPTGSGIRFDVNLPVIKVDFFWETEPSGSGYSAAAAILTGGLS
jgi:hypothetical protein